MKRYEDDDWPLLVRLNSPEMTEHLGGPETDEKLHDRHTRYVNARHDASGGSRGVFCFTVLLDPEGVAVGNLNIWEREWQGKAVYEMGWGILPEHQGRGLATAALGAALEYARGLPKRDAVHAFPSVENGPSNAICRKAGFTLMGEVDFEYPKGHWMRCHDWRFSLG